MHDVRTQVVGVEGKPTKKGGMVYAITLADGTRPSTFDLQKATKAQNSIGQVADVRLSTSADGKYLNFEDIAPAGQLPPLALPAGTPLGAPTIAQPFQASTIPVASPQSQDDRQRSIVRQSSLKTAFEYAGATGQDEAYAFDLAKRIYTAVTEGGQTASQSLPEASQPVAVQSTPQDVQQQVNDVLGNEAVSVGPPATAGPAW